MLKIALFGLNFNSGNLGCAALSYSFFDLLLNEAQRLETKLEVTFYDSVKSSLNGLPTIGNDFVDAKIFKYDKHNITALYKSIKTQDIVFDFTAGDSFSDYYGLSRFVKRTFNKTLVLFNKKTFILGPQTYGPFDSFVAKKWASFVIRHADRVFARDGKSLERAAKVSKRKDIKLVTDVAFLLPYKKEDYEKLCERNGKINIGFNFSGLLYSGGYTKDNQFGLTVDYAKYCEDIVKYFEDKTDRYNLWIVPHVCSKKEGNPDNDLIPTKVLSEKYPYVKVAPLFSSPMDAKSFIANMDVFSGARMHATIAAFSSKVATIPFSYSVKFEGLYGELNYDCCIHGKEETTQEAVKRTIDYVENVRAIQDMQEKSLAIADEKINMFVSDVHKFLNEKIK
ncbi:MAG: polysaccharide pyruvyl transferase family protein [Lachnospiraceae bacterium]|nr:polysaccharide pyruvyl transferase family protein [Lachnospiraceae bacterium]